MTLGQVMRTTVPCDGLSRRPAGAMMARHANGRTAPTVLRQRHALVKASVSHSSVAERRSSELSSRFDGDATGHDEALMLSRIVGR
jgi:hypothetical protein